MMRSSSKLILQIHDELDLKFLSQRLRQSQTGKETMEDVVIYSVPLIADVSYGSQLLAK